LEAGVEEMVGPVGAFTSVIASGSWWMPLAANVD